MKAEEVHSTSSTTSPASPAIARPAADMVQGAMTQRRSLPALIGQFGSWLLLAVAFVFFLFPLFWMIITSIKARSEVTLLPPRYVPFLDFQPVTDNYLAVFTKASELGTISSSQDSRAQEISAFPLHLLNSILIAGISTLLAVILGTLAAYVFSRFRVRGENDLLFFILSTRMLPPIVVLIPIFLMFTKPFGFVEGWAEGATDPGLKSLLTNIATISLRESYIGITLLYTTFGLPFVVWMMKGFFDEIPREYEEAAMLDGYSRAEAIWKFVIPEALPAMLATAVFVLITAWNEFVFVQILNPSNARTVPPFLYAIIGYGQIEWGRMAATSVVFLLPVVIFTFAVRNHLLRGVTFGAVRR